MDLSAAETLDLALVQLENVVERLLGDCSLLIETTKAQAQQKQDFSANRISNGTTNHTELHPCANSPTDNQVNVLEGHTEQTLIQDVTIGESISVSTSGTLALVNLSHSTNSIAASEGSMHGDAHIQQSSEMDSHRLIDPAQSDDTDHHHCLADYRKSLDGNLTLKYDNDLPTSTASHKDQSADCSTINPTESPIETKSQLLHSSAVIGENDVSNDAKLMPLVFDVETSCDAAYDPENQGEIGFQSQPIVSLHSSAILGGNNASNDSKLMPLVSDLETSCDASHDPQNQDEIRHLTSATHDTETFSKRLHVCRSSSADDERQNADAVPHKDNTSEASIDDKENRQPRQSLDKRRTLQKPRVFAECIEVVIAETPASVPAPIPKSYDEIVSLCRKVCRNPKTVWALRCSAMDAFSEYLKSSSSSTLLQDIAGLKSALILQIEDSRSAVVRSVCRLIASLAEVCKSQFEELAAFFLPKLLTRLYVTVRVISSSADQCIKSVMLSMNSATINLIPKLLLGLSDCHAAVRRGVCVYIRIAIESAVAAVPDLEPHLNILCSSLSHALKDSDRDVRVLSRTALHSIALMVPEFTLPNEVEMFDSRHRIPLGGQDSADRSDFSNLLK